MKLLLVVLVSFVAGISAGPSKYHYVSTKQFEDPDDHHMHPDPTEARTKSGKIRQGKFVEDEIKTEFWLNRAKAFVEEQVQKTPNIKKAKNIIMFMGDGMSHPSIAAARVQMGDEGEKLAFEDFPYTASSKTYCVDVQVADSACTATAYLSGVKTNDAVIGLSGNALRSNCAASNVASNRAESIAAWAMNAGKAAGFVTTTRVTHASPAGVYAHIADRDWENDFKIRDSGCDDQLVDDIAEQLVLGNVGSRLKVMFGGGSKNFIDELYQEHGTNGIRKDGRNLINEWRALNPTSTYVNSKQGLTNLDPANTQQVLGLFNSDHISYNLDVQRDGLQDVMPSLTDLTLKAIDILSQSDEGFFLFVEGGRIDHGHHDNFARYAIDETVEFSKAIEEAMKKIDTEETLVVVTADHGHVMTLAGYADRGGDIFGMGGNGDDGLPYMTLSYANGMGYYEHTLPTGRANPALMDTSPNDFMFPATVPRFAETHGGEDVGIWAVGPWAHLFQGTVEQNVIPHVMAYASCIGNGLKMCDT